jgi:hypothetical protein
MARTARGATAHRGRRAGLLGAALDTALDGQACERRERRGRRRRTGYAREPWSPPSTKVDLWPDLGEPMLLRREWTDERSESMET